MKFFKSNLKIYLKNNYVIIFYLIFLSTSCNFLDKEDEVTDPTNPPALELVASSSRQWTGVAVSKEGRVFVNYPNWKAGHTLSVAEVLDSLTVKPFPDDQWNNPDSTLPPSDHFICVQSVVTDKENFLWVLDPANPQRQGKYLGVIPGGAKLLKVDLATNAVVQKIIFSAPDITPQSYLNDIRIDEGRQIGYITDSNEGAILIVDLRTGKTRRLLSKDPVTKSESRTIVAEGIVWRQEDGSIPSVNSDGIALSQDKSYLYWRPLSGESFYRAPASILLDSALTDAQIKSKVEILGKFPPSDGLLEGKNGTIWLTSVEENGIRKYQGSNNAPLILSHPDLKWPDSFSEGPDSYIYVTASQLHLKNPPQPYKIFRFKP